MINFVRISLEIQKQKIVCRDLKIFKLLNLLGNQLISTLAAHVFVPSVLGENIPTAAEFVMQSAEIACRDIY